MRSVAASAEIVVRAVADIHAGGAAIGLVTLTPPPYVFSARDRKKSVV